MFSLEIAGWTIEIREWMVVAGAFLLCLVILGLCVLAHRWDQH